MKAWDERQLTTRQVRPPPAQQHRLRRERTASFGALIREKHDGIDPIVGRIIAGGERYTAVDAFEASHTLARPRRAAEPIWDAVDALLLPTAGFHPTLAQVQAEPVTANARLGRYTKFVNLMDLAGLAVPADPRADGLPFGVSLLAPAGGDERLLELWEVVPEALGVLMSRVPAPLAIGSVELADGRRVLGFVCEGYAAAGATDITGYGGWRAYLSSLRFAEHG